MKILILNGPNLNHLGKREPEIYGNQSFEDYSSELQFKFKNAELSYVQSNHEGELIDQLQEAEKDFGGIVLNAAGFSHTSVAIADAVKMISIPVIEVHISNIFAREEFRHHSFISPHVAGIIVGCGLKGYQMAVQKLIDDE
jgi:3-dehydroquinate dehydratase-2